MDELETLKFRRKETEHFINYHNDDADTISIVKEDLTVMCSQLIPQHLFALAKIIERLEKEKK